ncbi:uracil-DNA glycosylase [Clostridium sp. DL1XJH146]
MSNLLEIHNNIKKICNSYSNDSTSGYVFGNGPIPCPILIVGEAPGKTEVELGRPFVGKAGKTLDKYLEIAQLERNDVRITNTCFFRPIKIKFNQNGKSTISNRTPKAKEIDLFREVLDEEIRLVNPRIIITLGNIPLRRFTSYKAIGNCHGNIIFSEKYNLDIFPMYHPSSLTYNRNEEFETKYRADWKKLKKKLDSIVL